MMDVIAVKRHETDSWNAPPPRVVAVAASEEAAKKWIQELVDTSSEYMKGKTADWWIEYGTFSLEPMTVQE